MKVIIDLAWLGLVLCTRKITATYGGADASAHLSSSLTNSIFQITSKLASTPLVIQKNRRCWIAPRQIWL